MTIDEAIKMYRKIANTDSSCPRYCMRPCEECVKECKQVLEWLEDYKRLKEKQIPKKPDIEGDGYADGHLVYDTWICPNCGKYYEIDYDDYEYCPNCGQHIDRSQIN